MHKAIALGLKLRVRTADVADKSSVALFDTILTLIKWLQLPLLK